MTRTYTLKKRAESQAETRRRIVEAAVDLHGSIGPAQTTFTMVAERAGVQRHTLYAHFPDERSLLMACSGLFHEQAPPPSAEPWRRIVDPGERLRAGLTAIYAWYERHAQLLSCVLRDAEHSPLVREISQLRLGPIRAVYDEVLGAKLNARQRALLQLALSFFTWRTLTGEAGLKSAAAVKAMTDAIACAGKS
jgi:AcrR family transcriptional regulator